MVGSTQVQGARRCLREVLTLVLPACAAVTLVVATTSQAGGEHAQGVQLDPDLPRPAPQGRPPGHDPKLENDRCATCHTEIADEWRGSLHRQAWTDPLFQSAYQIEQQAFCRGCHAPEADASLPPSASAAHVGVGCTTCHVQGDSIIGANAVAADAPHAVFVDGRMSGPQACGSCHQFNFPNLGIPMQDTLAEHAASQYRQTPCQSCHMKSVQGQNGKTHRSHDFSVISDPEMIRSAATVKAKRVGTKTIEITISSAVVGHAFPTGDMFRRLEIRGHGLSPNGAPVRSVPVHLGRTFDDRPTHPNGEPLGFHRAERDDSRVRAPGNDGARRVVLHFDRPIDGIEIFWEVAYQRLGTAMAASFGVDQAKDEIIVDSGKLAPANGTERKASR